MSKRGSHSCMCNSLAFPFSSTLQTITFCLLLPGTHSLGCWADREIPKEGMCGTLELFCCHPDVRRGGPACSLAGRRVANILAEGDEGPTLSPETRASLPAQSRGTQSAVRKLQCSWRGCPSGCPHDSRYLLWMLAIPTIHTSDLLPEASQADCNTNKLPKHKPLLPRLGVEDIEAGIASSSGGNLSFLMYLEKVKSLTMLEVLPSIFTNFGISSPQWGNILKF